MNTTRRITTLVAALLFGSCAGITALDHSRVASTDRVGVVSTRLIELVTVSRGPHSETMMRSHLRSLPTHAAVRRALVVGMGHGFLTASPAVDLGDALTRQGDAPSAGIVEAARVADIDLLIELEVQQGVSESAWLRGLNEQNLMVEVRARMTELRTGDILWETRVSRQFRMSVPFGHPTEDNFEHSVLAATEDLLEELAP
jgi:hypothetical protein